MIEFELNGKVLSVPEGTTIIEAADESGDYIPRFCYHKKLSVAANCRMCLVEVEKSGKPLPACATPIMPGMKVTTKSEMALKAQRDVMEFLLINHPLDCPICDQGGECELQDLSLGFGRSKSEYREPKRAVCSQDIGPLIETEMTRCIQCTRCVRFGEEVAGMRELGAVNRGEKEEITTYVQHVLQSEMSANIIDLCPVGALTNKPARYKARGWELAEHASISPMDCVGTNMYLHSRDHRIIRAVPRENEAINETWMSDRDRFCVEGLYHSDRVTKPLMKKHGEWVEVEWQYALEAIAHLTREFSGNDIAGIADYSSTTEEYFVFQQFIRGLGSSHVDHRIREQDFSDQSVRPLFPQLNESIADIDHYDALLLLESNVRHEQPIIGTRIFKATQENLSVMSMSTKDHAFVFPLAEKIIQDDLIGALAQLSKALGVDASGLTSVTVSDAAKNMAQKLLAAENPALFVGAKAFRHPKASTLRALLAAIKAKLPKLSVGVLSEGANSAGAWIAGCLPHRGAAGQICEKIGRNAQQLLTTQPAKAYFLLNAELEKDAAYDVLPALTQADLVVCIGTFASEQMREYADFILPAVPFSENEGTYINACGTWQSFSAAVRPLDQAKPAWKIIRALATMMGLSTVDYVTVSEITDVLKAQYANAQTNIADLTGDFSINITSDAASIPEWRMTTDNPLVRRAQVLQDR